MGKNNVQKSKKNKSKRAEPSKNVANRDKKKYPGLSKTNFSKIKQEYHDIDYADRLSEKDKDYMSRFMEEHLGARMKHPGKLVNKGSRVRKQIFGANNARNRDLQSLINVTALRADSGVTLGLGSDLGPVSDNQEDIMIDIIDNREKIERKLKLTQDRLNNPKLVKKDK